ncbi:hypothetical protein CEXT_527741 [Caerostris extrusa]|uniref:Uncharacterized protein n=1 Tax=Caerostris extrusa TaxID=172846 RepID=A0AAV4UF32_CAEEX|nr:hypothetical protein CEXT_527741 [Caerostris extrusa]
MSEMKVLNPGFAGNRHKGEQYRKNSSPARSPPAWKVAWCFDPAAIALRLRDVVDVRNLLSNCRSRSHDKDVRGSVKLFYYNRGCDQLHVVMYSASSRQCHSVFAVGHES